MAPSSPWSKCTFHFSLPCVTQGISSAIASPARGHGHALDAVQLSYDPAAALLVATGLDFQLPMYIDPDSGDRVFPYVP